MTERDYNEALYNQQKDWEAEQEFYASESAKAEADIKAQEENEMTMNEQELREKIAKLIQNNASNLIDSIITGADMPTKTWREVANQILAIIKEAGYVKLAEDQTLPEIPSFAYDKEESRKLLQRGAINYFKLLASWRKVEVIKNGS